MDHLLHHFELTLPLFGVVLLGWLAVRALRCPVRYGHQLTRVVFGALIPAMLFRMMAGLARLPPVDARVPVVFFGSCLLVFAIGRVVGRAVFRLDGTQQSVFALGGVFSNNVMLGIPLATITLGEKALPSVALVLVFNALTLWTMVTVSVEWSRHGAMSVAGFAKTLRGVLTNPLIIAILCGVVVGLLGLELPPVVERPLALVSKVAGPLALLALGMGLAEYGLAREWRESLAITGLKLVVQPLVVWGSAWLLGLPPLETRVVVLLASLAVGVNVYLMAKQFEVMQGAVAGSLMLSTLMAALTTPVFLALTG
jgi:malonate transporter